MTLLLTHAVKLTGPLYVLLLAAVLLGRRFFPDVRLLDELSEPILLLAATSLALALAGIFVQIV